MLISISVEKKDFEVLPVVPSFSAGRICLFAFFFFFFVSEEGSHVVKGESWKAVYFC